MKKFLGILALAVTMVACNDSADGTDAAADSARIADSIKRAEDSINASMPVTPDTTVLKVDTTGAAGADTTGR